MLEEDPASESGAHPDTHLEPSHLEPSHLEPSIDELLARLLVGRSRVKVDLSTGEILEEDGTPPRDGPEIQS